MMRVHVVLYVLVRVRFWWSCSVAPMLLVTLFAPPTELSAAAALGKDACAYIAEHTLMCLLLCVSLGGFFCCCVAPMLRLPQRRIMHVHTMYVVRCHCQYIWIGILFRVVAWH
jgi:hypothetical protein